VILTGTDIVRQVNAGQILIEPFHPENVEPNSYGFHLGDSMICYDEVALDCKKSPKLKTLPLLADGVLLVPGVIYLGSTLERMGSDHYAATLYARRSTSTLGMWIQVSAPLGHTGALIPWTLEITVVHPILIYPRMKIGKIAFWRPQGEIRGYQGKYSRSRSAVPSRLAAEWPGPQSRLTEACQAAPLPPPLEEVSG
jgi:dCTP deaminase